jgi:hypothetical protein
MWAQADAINTERDIEMLSATTQATLISGIARWLGAFAALGFIGYGPNEIAHAGKGQEGLLIEGRTTVASHADGRQLYEPQLANDPLDSRRWVAVAMLSDSGKSFPEWSASQTCVVFVSVDDATSWTRVDLGVPRCWDPWVTFTPDGAVLLSALDLKDGTLFVYRSVDGGKSWSSHPAVLGTGHDHPVLTIDRSTGERRSWVYVSSHHAVRAADGLRRWGPWVARSRDGGRTFDDPVTVVPNNLHNLAESSAVLTDGTLIVPFVDAGHPAVDHPNGENFERRRAWTIRSIDGGRTFSIPLFVTDACGPPPGFRLSALVADLNSNVYRDRLYFACREVKGGPIVVTHSADRGDTWTDPVRVTQSAPAVAERVPGLAANGRGVLLVAWIDAPEGAGHNCEQAVHAAASVDGGASFTADTLVSSTSTCPDDAPVRSTTGGDYFGLVPTTDGGFRVLWGEVAGGLSTLKTAILRVH